MKRTCLSVTLAIALLTSGCQTPVGNDMQTARVAYAASDWKRALPPARRVAKFGGYLENEAAYIAGMSAFQTGDRESAMGWLKVASADRNATRAGKAMAAMGRIDFDRQRYEVSAASYAAAAEKLEGQDQAAAWFSAAEASRKLSRPAAARTYFTLARAATKDEAFRRQIDQSLDISGWTIQIGPYADKKEAHAVAQLMAHQSQTLQIGDPRLLTVEVEGSGQAYVVQLGQFAQYEAAAEARKQINIDKTVVAPLDQWVK